MKGDSMIINLATGVVLCLPIFCAAHAVDNDMDSASAAQGYVVASRRAYEYAASAFFGDTFPSLETACLLSDWLREAHIARSRSGSERFMTDLAHLARMRRIHGHALNVAAKGLEAPTYRILADYYTSEAAAKVFHSLGGRYKDAARSAIEECVKIAQRGFDAELATCESEFSTYPSWLRSMLFWVESLQENEVERAESNPERQKAVERSLRRITKLMDLAKTEEDRQSRAFETALFQRLKSEILLGKLSQKNVTEESHARVRPAEKLYSSYWNQLKGGRGSFGSVYKWSNEWRLGLLEDEKDRAKRMAANTAHLRRMEELFSLAKDKYFGDAIEFDPLNVYLAQARYFVARSKEKRS